MKMKTFSGALFPSIKWWIWLLIPLLGIGFYPTYFSILTDVSSLLHIHAVLLMVWVAMLIVQPILVTRSEFKYHRLIGKLSMVLVPVMIFVMWLVIRKTYFGLLGDGDTLSAFAAETIFIPVIYTVWLLLFYYLAIIFRRKNVYHATFMFASMLTLLGPAIDRMIFQIYRHLKLDFNLFAEFAVFVLIDFILATLILYQYKKGYSIAAGVISLALYLIGQLAYIVIPSKAWWGTFLRMVL